MNHPTLRPGKIAAAALLTLAALGATAALRGATTFASPPDAAGNLSYIVVTTSGLNGACPNDVAMVALTFGAGTNAPSNQQQISVYGEILTAADDGGCDGFTDTCDPNGSDPDPAWWVIEANTSAGYTFYEPSPFGGTEVDGGASAVDPGTNNCGEDGAGTWPDNGGWEQPVADRLTTTSETFVVYFQVEVPASALPNTTYYLELGVNYGGAQGQTGASEGYVCLPFTTGSGCPSPTPTTTVSPTFTVPPTFTPSAVPTLPITPSATPPPSTPSPTATQSAVPGGTDTFTPSPSATPTPRLPVTPTPTLTPTAPAQTDTPTRTPDATATRPGNCGVTARPNFIRGGGSVEISAQDCGGGIVRLRVLRQNGRLIASLYQGYLESGRDLDLTWDGDDAEGAPVASGIYYVVFVQSDGRAILQKVLVVR